MAYRRKQGVQRGSVLEEEEAVTSPYNPPPLPLPEENSSSLAAKAIRASSSAHRESSLSSAYGHSFISKPPGSPSPCSAKVLSLSSPIPMSKKNSNSYEYTSMKNLSEPKQGFWGVLARKAKAIIEDDQSVQQFEAHRSTRNQMPDTRTMGRDHKQFRLPDSNGKMENPPLQKGLDAIASSLNYIGSTIGNAFEEGLTIVENQTADIIQETRKLQIRKKGSNFEAQNQASNASSRHQQQSPMPNMQPLMQTDLEIQLKASRDVAMAMAAKAKLLLRELKTVKADLSFAKERCFQLEDKNRILRVSHEKGDNPEDDDLVRLQLETLLAEKARLAQENSVFARENRFLREIVEYHQLTMQDVVYLDEGTEEVTEVYPITPHTIDPELTPGVSSLPTPFSEHTQLSKTVTPLSSYIDIPMQEDIERR